jgi:hypothetical protein
MKDSRAAPGFGEVDLDLGEESSKRTGKFGEVDELDDSPPSESGVSKRALEAARKLPRADAATRIVQGDALAALTRSDMPPPLDGEGDGPTSVRDGSVRSGSGVAARDDRVDAMREAYARGDTAGALSLASEIALPTPDQFVPIDVEPPIHERDCTRIAPAAPAPSILTLTERHSIPRIKKSPKEVARLPIDHRAGFLLSNIDGMQTMEEILDVCGMPPEEALDLIRKLERLGVIEIE